MGDGGVVNKDSLTELSAFVAQAVQNKLTDLIATMLKNSKPNYDKIISYKKKYQGASNDFIALRLITSASRKTSLNAAAGGALITGAQINALINKTEKSAGQVIPIAGAAMAEDIVVATSVQIQLIIDIAALYGSEFNLEDEEDVWVIFALATGLQITDDLIRGLKIIFEEAGIKNFRRLLRYKSGRANVQALARKIFGPKLAKMLAEKSLLKLVLFANIAIGAGFNYLSTSSIGHTAMLYGKTRAAVLKHIERIQEFEGDYSPMVLYTLRYISEFFDDKKAFNDFALVWRSATTKLRVSEDMEDEIEELDDIKDAYPKLIAEIQNSDIKHELYYLGETSNFILV